MVKAPYFDMSLAGHARTVIRGWSAVRHRSLLTDEGLALLVELTVEVGKVNQMSAQVCAGVVCLSTYHASLLHVDWYCGVSHPCVWCGTGCLERV